MTTPRTTSAADSTGTNGVNGAFPTNVLAFAAANEVADCLQPLLDATQRIFPTARFVKVSVEEDAELRDNTQIVFDVQVSGLSSDESWTARGQWHDALSRVCPKARIFIFCLLLDFVR